MALDSDHIPPSIDLPGNQDRLELVLSLARANNLGDLTQQLSRALSSFDIEDFEVFLASDNDGVLVFSRGRTSSTEGKIAFREHPWFTPLFDGESLSLSNAISADDPVFSEASAAIALQVPSGTQGVLVLYGPIPSSVFRTPKVAELLTMTELFSVGLHQTRTREMLQRTQQRATAKLEEFQDAQDILFLGEKAEILHAVLARGLQNLGAMTGAIVLGDSNGWELAEERGELGSSKEPMQHMVRQCFTQLKPGLINALSGEESWTFDVDTIHMASVVAFPLHGHERVVGALIAFDATVSLDNIEMVQATARAGAIAVENWEVRQKMLEQQRLQEQMDLAARAQQRLLPASDPKFRGMRIKHFSRYCDETGGDYVDAFTHERSSDVGTLIIGDVSGHGLGAALMMVDLRARLRTMFQQQDPWSLHTLLQSANTVLKRESAPEEFVTLFVATLDSRTGVFRYANAGHEPPLLYKSHENRWLELEATGVPLGLVEPATYGVRAMCLEPGDILIAMTDGITEAQTESGETLGTEPIKRVVESMGEAPAEDIVAAVVDRTLSHRDQQAFTDDLTFLVMSVQEVSLQVFDKPPILHGEKIFETEFPSTITAKDEVLLALESELSKRFQKFDTAAFVLSCEEAMSNSLVHGNRNDAGMSIRIRLIWDNFEHALTGVVEDSGEGFEVQARVIEHFEAPALRRTGGRGLIMMANLVDRVAYWNGGRSVALTQRFQA